MTFCLGGDPSAVYSDRTNELYVSPGEYSSLLKGMNDSYKKFEEKLSQAMHKVKMSFRKFFHKLGEWDTSQNWEICNFWQAPLSKLVLGINPTSLHKFTTVINIRLAQWITISEILRLFDNQAAQQNWETPEAATRQLSAALHKGRIYIWNQKISLSPAR